MLKNQDQTVFDTSEQQEEKPLSEEEQREIDELFFLFVTPQALECRTTIKPCPNEDAYTTFEICTAILLCHNSLNVQEMSEDPLSQQFREITHENIRQRCHVEPGTISVQLDEVLSKSQEDSKKWNLTANATIEDDQGNVHYLTAKSVSDRCKRRGMSWTLAGVMSVAYYASEKRNGKFTLNIANQHKDRQRPVNSKKKGDEISWSKDKRMYKELLNAADVVLEKITLDASEGKKTFSPDESLNLRIRLSNRFNRNDYFDDGIWGFAKNRELTGSVYVTESEDLEREETFAIRQRDFHIFDRNLGLDTGSIRNRPRARHTSRSRCFPAFAKTYSFRRKISPQQRRVLPARRPRRKFQ